MLCLEARAHHPRLAVGSTIFPALAMPMSPIGAEGAMV